MSTDAAQSAPSCEQAEEVATFSGVFTVFLVRPAWRKVQGDVFDGSLHSADAPTQRQTREGGWEGDLEWLRRSGYQIRQEVEVVRRGGERDSLPPTSNVRAWCTGKVRLRAPRAPRITGRLQL